MSTAIEWTDETWNPVVGCTKVSQGCKHCYAKTLHDKRHKAALAGKAVHPQYLKPFETVQLMPERLDAPLHWRKPRRVFVNSVSDLFHEDVPDEFLDQVFAIMAHAHQHTFQVLTKRPARMRAYLSVPERVERVNRVVADLEGWTFRDGQQTMRWPRDNIWLGVSVENQTAADERVPLLIQTPAAIRFLSCEPLLGPVDLTEIREPDSFYRFDALTGEETYPGSVRTGILAPLDWVIVGGESGPHARPCDIAWITAIVADCNLSGVPCFVKQLGARPWDGLEALLDNGTIRLADRKGGDPNEWPLDLRVRQFPGEVPA